MNKLADRNLVSRLKDDILLGSVLDVMDLWQLVRFLRDEKRVSDGFSIRSYALRAIRELMDEGLAEPGDVTTKGFQPWNLSTDEALEWIAGGWDLLKKDPDPGNVVWLNNTAAGNAIARKLLADQKK